MPVPGCSCPACCSKNPKDRRYRSAVYIEKDGRSLLIDTPAEFRIRAIEYKIKRVDAVLFTHAHSDHTAGLDDMRRFNELSGAPIPVMGDEKNLAEIKQRFSYIFKKTQEGGGKPRLILNSIRPFQEFNAAGISFTALPVMHGTLKIFGYRAGGFAYITDVSMIPEKTYRALAGVDILVLDALRKEKHPTHFNIEEAAAAAARIGAKKTYFTHIAHSVRHAELEKMLPKNIRPAYDGLEIRI